MNETTNNSTATINPTLMSYSSYIITNDAGNMLMGFARLARRQANDGYLLDVYTRNATYDGKFKIAKEIKERCKLAIESHDDARMLYSSVVSDCGDVSRVFEYAEEMLIPYEVLASTPYTEEDLAEIAASI